ncbi:MAG TPA: DUF4129 domain-containing protein, partial [Symbiobacteriaceae bacterium]|nr:DUF4129 domain-containing protein [Symbiobacteriaceae bacterium]
FLGFLRFLGLAAYLIIHRWLRLVAPILEWFFKRVMAALRKPQEQEPADIEMGDNEVQIDPDPWVDMNQVMPYIQAAVAIALVITALVIIARISRKRKPPTQVEEEIISLGFWNNLLADLKSLFGRGTAAVQAALAPTENIDPRSPRMLFRRLQRWGQGVGRPRWQNETPSTYSSVLGDFRPADAGAVDAVTAVYNQARYGASGPGEADVAAAAKAVDGLEAAAEPKS